MNKKISELTSASNVRYNDIVMILQNGQNKQATVDEVRVTNRELITLSNTINSNENYTLPLKYKVGNDSLEVHYCDTKLKKSVDYNEVGSIGQVSNTIQFLSSIGDLDMSTVDGFENFEETLEFIVRGDYNDN